MEPCCGSASLTLHLLGARRPILPYQGSKWRFRHALGELVRDLVGEGAPATVELSDPSAWGVVAGCIVQPEARASVVERLEALGAEDPRAVYERLHGAPVPAEPEELAAQYLFLQRLSYSGKAVGTRDGRWASPGFNKTSAYGLAGTERFGEVHPMIPSLIRTLRSYRTLVPAEVRARRGPARAPQGPVAGPTLVYLDPPYANSTAYPDGALDRDGAVALAADWAEAGAHVLVSESEPVAELVACGWTASCISTGRQDTSPFRGKQAEWVTASPRR